MFSEISQCCSKPDLTSEDKEKLLLLQSKLDDIFLKRAQGAFVRSKAKWTEEGEKKHNILQQAGEKKTGK